MSNKGGRTFMSFSEKAEEIHKYIVSVGEADEWVGTAKGYIARKGQHEPGPQYKFDYEGLKDRLKADLSGAVGGATDVIGKRLHTGLSR
jgi:hypothetical protein